MYKFLSLNYNYRVLVIREIDSSVVVFVFKVHNV